MYLPSYKLTHIESREYLKLKPLPIRFQSSTIYSIRHVISPGDGELMTQA